MPTLVADEDVRAVVSRCQDSPGAAVYVLPLAWTGLLLGVAAVCWGGRQLVTAARRKALRVGLAHAALCAVLPVAAVAAPLQYALAQTAAHDTGYQHNRCFGQGQAVTLSTEWTV
ncbi:hypothetical protein ACH4E7_15695 [Kitasatospora sp. NPDC018058]|uniref:hypothetical protein n=1 Tax=Kitasatospora sp. NPDC018058 TaxID=3364025 RepID=UPI0037BF001B